MAWKTCLRCGQELVRLLNDQQVGPWHATFSLASEALEAESARLERDVASWRTAWEAENAGREVFENDLNAAKHLFNGEHLALMSDCDLLKLTNEDLEQEIRMLSGDAVQKRRLIVSGALSSGPGA